MRRLSLHASALNNDEYELYTSSLKELADDDQVQQHGSGQGTDGDDEYFEKMVIGVREVRAWMRGRYSSLSATIIDNILKYFSPNLNHSDTLSGGQFFVALRLVIHALDGKEIDRALAFVQAHPATVNTPTSRPSSPSKRYAEPQPPPMPSRRAFTESQTQTKPLHDHPQPPLHPSQRSESVKSQPLQHHATHNPFVPRPPKSNPRSEDGTSSNTTKGPPLPPRKQGPPPLPISHPQVIVPPPRHATYRAADRSISPHKFIVAAAPLPISLSSSPPTSSPSPLMKPPQPPPKLSTHVTSALIKQSLQASKAAQSLKRAEEHLEKERVMQVLKSSNTNASNSVSGGSNVSFHRARSRSPANVKAFNAATSSSASLSSGSSEDQRVSIHRWKSHQIQRKPSPPMSTNSLEQVALATSNSIQTHSLNHPAGPFRTPVDAPTLSSSEHTHSPFSSPGRVNLDLPNGPPPTHPDRKPTSYFSYNTSSSSNQSAPQRPKDPETFEAIYGPAPSMFGNIDPSFPPSTPVNSNQSPTSRVFRSKSMHHPSPPLPPIPPPVRRKRPESVQVLKSGEMLFRSEQPTVNVFTDDDGRTPPCPPPQHRTHTSSRNTSTHRRSSLSVSSAPQQNEYVAHTHASPLNMSNIQRTIATLQPKLEQLQPKLDKARYKAEAGLSRRGFVSGRHRAGVEGEEEESLMGGDSSSLPGGRGRLRGTTHAWANARDWESQSDQGPRGKESSRQGGGASVFDDPVVDVDGDSVGKRLGDDSSDDDGDHGMWREGRMASESQEDVVETDNLKWPAGEGWKPL